LLGAGAADVPAVRARFELADRAHPIDGLANRCPYQQADLTRQQRAFEQEVAPEVGDPAAQSSVTIRPTAHYLLFICTPAAAVSPDDGGRRTPSP
jgi:hypothetical protein